MVKWVERLSQRHDEDDVSMITLFDGPIFRLSDGLFPLGAAMPRIDEVVPGVEVVTA